MPFRKTWLRVFLFGVIFSLVVGFFSAPTGQAAPDEVASGAAIVAEYENPVSERPSLFMDFVKLVFSLAFVVLLAYVLVRVLGKKIKRIQQGDYIEIIDSMPLGVNRGIHIVYVAGKYLIVGMTEHNINVLGTVEDEEHLELLSGKRMLSQGELDFKIAPINWQRIYPKKQVDEGKDANETTDDVEALFSKQYSSIKSLRKRLSKGDRDD